MFSKAALPPFPPLECWIIEEVQCRTLASSGTATAQDMTDGITGARLTKLAAARTIAGTQRPPGERGLELKTTERVPKRNSTFQLQRLARERADRQARRIPWQRLLEVRNQYIDWQEFYLWVRSILEVEERIPDWLTEILATRCPGFLDSQNQVSQKEAQKKPVYFRLEDWIDDHVFGTVKRDGWFNAVTFYAVREPRYQRAQVCWSQSVKRWREVRPINYPSLEQWKALAAQCDETARLVPAEREARASVQRIPRERFAEALGRYIDWEAFAYWARPAMELSDELPAEVARELEQRCPGFLEVYRKLPPASKGGVVQPWSQLMAWVADHFFPEAKAGHWCDAIISAAHIHPRAIRTQEFSDHCTEIWSAGLPTPYPSFESWRLDADAYIDLGESNS